MITPWLVGQRELAEDMVKILLFELLGLPSVGPGGSITKANFRMPDFARPYLISVSVTAVVVITQLLIMLSSIRRNLLQAYRGDDCEIPARKHTRNLMYITANFRFAGALIGYVILAFIFLNALVLLIAIAIELYIIVGSRRLLEQIAKPIIPILLFTVFKIYLNKVLAQFVFLQTSGNVLTMNNRRVFTLFMYFNFFLDAFLGLFAAVARLLKSVFGGIIYMCRLDYSPLGRKLETLDDGFNAYCGFIHVECAHRHPVLLCFMSHLLRSHVYGPTTRRWSKARHKWALAVFLLNNPTLIYRRKRFLTRSEEGDMRLVLIGRKNFKDMAFDESRILARRTTIVSDIELHALGERCRF